MINTHINTCVYCGQQYCIECSENSGWELFCSDRCEKNYKQERQEEDKNESDK